MGSKPTIKSAIVYCSRQDVRSLVKADLRAYSVDKIETVADNNECQKALETDKFGLLVIDWSLGPAEVVKIFDFIKSDYKVQTRPILLIAPAASKQLLATGYEYSVTHTLLGEVSKSLLGDAMKELMYKVDMEAPLRAVLLKIAKQREAGDWDAANDVLEPLVSKLEDNPRVAAELAENYIFQERWDDAIAIMKPFENMDPPYIRAQHILGRCYMRKGFHKEAGISLHKAKLLNPYNVSRLVELGNVLLDMDKVAEAKEVFSEAQDIDPKNVDAKVGIGQCLLLSGDVNEAMEIFKDTSGPKELAAVFNLSAIMAMRSGRFEDGMELYNAAFKILKSEDKLLAKLYFNKGVGYRRQKMAKNSLDMFQKSAELDPEFHKAKRNFCLEAEKLGIPIPPNMKVTKTHAKEQAPGEVLSEDELVAKPLPDRKTTALENDLKSKDASDKDPFGLDFDEDDLDSDELMEEVDSF